MLVFMPEQLEDVVDAFNTYSHIPDAKSSTTIILGCLPPTYDPIIAVIVCYDGPEEEGRKLYKPFFDAKPIADRTATRTFLEMVPLQVGNRLTLEYIHGQNAHDPWATIYDYISAHRDRDTNHANEHVGASSAQSGAVTENKGDPNHLQRLCDAEVWSAKLGIFFL